MFQINSDSVASDGPTVLQIKHIVLVLMLLGMGLCLSIIVVITECLYGRPCRL